MTFKQDLPSENVLSVVKTSRRHWSLSDDNHAPDSGRRIIPMKLSATNRRTTPGTMPEEAIPARFFRQS